MSNAGSSGEGAGKSDSAEQTNLNLHSRQPTWMRMAARARLRCLQRDIDVSAFGAYRPSGWDVPTVLPPYTAVYVFLAKSSDTANEKRGNRGYPMSEGRGLLTASGGIMISSTTESAQHSTARTTSRRRRWWNYSKLSLPHPRNNKQLESDEKAAKIQTNRIPAFHQK